MMLNSVNNNQPTFGMALVKPKNRTSLESFAKYIGTASDDFITRITARRGLRQVIKENLENPINIHYIPIDNAFKVNDKVISVTPRSEAKNKLQEIGRRMIRGFNILFNPKGELPDALRLASNEAKSEWEKELAEAARKAKAEARLNKAINKTGEIFDKMKQ